MRARITFVMILFAAHPAFGAATDMQKCEAAKLKAAGKYALCLLKAQSKFAKNGEADKLSEAHDKCAEVFAAAFAKAEEKWNVECPTAGDATEVLQQVQRDTDVLTELLAANEASECTADCGNGAVEGGEACDAGSPCAAGWCFGTNFRIAFGTCDPNCLTCGVCRKLVATDLLTCALECSPPASCSSETFLGLRECVGGGCQSDADCPVGMTCRHLTAMVQGNGMSQAPSCLSNF